MRKLILGSKYMFFYKNTLMFVIFVLLVFPTNLYAKKLESSVYSFDTTNKSYTDFSNRINQSGLAHSANVGYAFPSQFDISEYLITDYATGNQKFFGGAFDGRNIWLAPYSSNNIVKFDTVTKTFTGIDVTPYATGATKYGSAIFDGTFIWILPTSADNVLRLNPSNNAITTFSVTAHATGNNKFGGSVYDGENIWLVPANSTKLVKVSTSNGAMTGYDVTSVIPENYRFAGGVYDGTYLWLAPNVQPKVLRVKLSDMSMKTYDLSQFKDESTSAGYVSTGLFDGKNIWFAPHNMNSLVKINTLTEEISGYDITDYNVAAHRAASIGYDGLNLWLVPCLGYDFIRFSPTDNKVLNSYNLEERITGYSAPMFSGIIYDGKDMWFIPSGADQLIRLSPLHSIITEKFYTIDGVELSSLSTMNADPGYVYNKSCKEIEGYDILGYKINDGKIINGNPVIDGVLNDYTITCMYEVYVEPEEQIESNEKPVNNPQTGEYVNYFIYVIVIVSATCLYNYLKKKKIGL